MAARTEPSVFRRIILIDSDTGPIPLGGCVEPWQNADFERLDDGWKNAVFRDHPNSLQRAYLERSRGHSKTTDIAISALWALWAGSYTLSGIAAAADVNQAGLIRAAIARMTRLNPWISDIDVQQRRILNRRTGSELKILTSDADTSYGELPDFVVADELTHWKKPDLWESVFSSAGKRPHCFVVVISNAGMGMGTSWQWGVRETARTSDRWVFSRIDGPVASWVTEETLDEQREALVSVKSFNRLWLNQWQTERGDALDPGDIEACTTLSSPVSARGDMRFLCGLDLGVRNDHSALITVGIDAGDQSLHLADVASWNPKDSAGGQVDLVEVENYCRSIADRYQIDGIVYDPHQAMLMAQRLQAAGILMVEQPFTPKNCTSMARAILTAFRNRTINLYPDELLQRDLLRLSIVERPSGFKLEGTRDELGHCDRGIALAIVLPVAQQWAEHLSLSRWQEPLEEVLQA